MTSFHADAFGESDETSGGVRATISGGQDNASEITPGGAVHLNVPHADLRGAFRHAFRFPLDIPPGTTIKPGACIQFTASHSRGPAHVPGSGTCRARIQVEAADDAAALENRTNAISARTYLPVLEWPIEDDWAAGDRTAAQRTPDLSPLLQAIIDRPGFRRGNHVFFMVSASTPSGVERAVAGFDHQTHGGATRAAELAAEWELRSGSSPKARPFDLAGFGGNVTGGEGATEANTFTATNTKDSGAGSFRQAAADAAAAPRDDPKLISVEIPGGGVIQLSSLVRISGSNITVTGRNAPAPWAISTTPTFNGPAVLVSGNNILLEHIRIYRGTTSLGPERGGDGKAITTSGSDIAHRFCSYAFGNDENCTTWNSRNVSYQYCLIFWPLCHNMDGEKKDGRFMPHAYNTIVGGDGSPKERKVTYDKCVVAYEQGERAYRVQQSHVEIKNSVAFHWGSLSASVWVNSAFHPVPLKGNVQSCLFLQASNGSAGAPLAIRRDSSDAHKEKFHVSSDCIWQRPDGSRVTGWSCVNGGKGTEGADHPLDLGVPPGKDVKLIGTADDGAALWAHLEPLVGAILPVRAWVDNQALIKVGQAVGGASVSSVLIDSVFRKNDPNTNSNADHGTAPLADYANGDGWQEALTGP